MNGEITMENLWITSTNEECWTSSEEYKTKEEAIAGAVVEHGINSEERFFVGQKSLVVIGPYDESTFLENYIEQQTEEHSEWAESWIDEVNENKEIEAFVRLRMEEISNYIMEKCPPDFYTVENIETHSAQQ
jgi:hypothetical protein